MRCAVAVLPAAAGDAERAARSVAAAAAHGRGGFSEIAMLAASGGGERDALASAAEQAATAGFDRLFVLTAAETAVADLFVKAAPALRVAEALWGGAGRIADGGHVALERVTRLAEEEFDRFFHLALRWWIGPAHFAPPRRVLAALEGGTGEAWRARYLLALWRGKQVMKTAQAFTDFHGVLPTLAVADREHLLDVLAHEPVFLPVTFGAHRLLLPYTGCNPVIERDHTNGRFFEEGELRHLAERLPRGMRIVDAGANTGNHTAFFARVMEAERVVPLEPDADAVSAIRRTVAANGLANVDCRHLGVAVGAAEGLMRAVFSEGGGLGATRFLPDAGGTTRVRRARRYGSRKGRFPEDRRGGDGDGRCLQGQERRSRATGRCSSSKSWTRRSRNSSNSSIWPNIASKGSSQTRPTAITFSHRPRGAGRSDGDDRVMASLCRRGGDPRPTRGCFHASRGTGFSPG